MSFSNVTVKDTEDIDKDIKDIDLSSESSHAVSNEAKFEEGELTTTGGVLDSILKTDLASKAVFEHLKKEVWYAVDATHTRDGEKRLKSLSESEVLMEQKSVDDDLLRAVAKYKDHIHSSYHFLSAA